MNLRRIISVGLILVSLAAGIVAGFTGYPRWQFWRGAVRWDYVVLEHLNRPPHGPARSTAAKGALVEIFVDGRKTHQEEVAVDDFRDYPIGGRLSWYYNERLSEWPERAEFLSYWAQTFAWSATSITAFLLGLAGLFRSKKEEPNQTPEPTPTAVTPRADARVAPAAGVAHL